MSDLRVLAILPHAIPSATIGVIQPLQMLHARRQITARFAFEYWVSPREIAQADVLVFCRNMEPRYAGALHAARALGKPILYELDDNFFDFPPDAPLAEYHRDPARLAQLTEYIASATLVRVYSQTLRDRVAAINSDVTRVEGPVDWNLVTPVHRAPESAREVWIVYATSRISDALAGIFADALERILSEHRDQVRMFFWGYPSARFARYPNVRFLNYIPDYARFFRRFTASGFDLGLAPLLNDVFHRSKSNNKFREYGAAGIAGIYSNVSVYSECVQPDITGVLVDNDTEAWHAGLTTLIQDGARRRAMQNQARQYARAHYDLEKTCAVWLEQLQTACAARQVPKQYSIVLPDRAAPIQNHNLMRVLLRLGQLGLRFTRRARTLGLRAAWDMARWSLHDLSLWAWNIKSKW